MVVCVCEVVCEVVCLSVRVCERDDSITLIGEMDTCKTFADMANLTVAPIQI